MDSNPVLDAIEVAWDHDTASTEQRLVLLALCQAALEETESGWMARPDLPTVAEMTRIPLRSVKTHVRNLAKMRIVVVDPSEDLIFIMRLGQLTAVE